LLFINDLLTEQTLLAGFCSWQGQNPKEFLGEALQASWASDLEFSQHYVGRQE
jgi:hypothetical protein